MLGEKPKNPLGTNKNAKIGPAFLLQK